MIQSLLFQLLAAHVCVNSVVVESFGETKKASCSFLTRVVIAFSQLERTKHLLS
jgi:hypothetical protein